MKYSYISPAVTRLLGFTPQEMKRITFPLTDSWKLVW
jgi:hypothetical protein